MNDPNDSDKIPMSNCNLVFILHTPGMFKRMMVMVMVIIEPGMFKRTMVAVSTTRLLALVHIITMGPVTLVMIMMVTFSKLWHFT